MGRHSFVLGRLKECPIRALSFHLGQLQATDSAEENVGKPQTQTAYASQRSDFGCQFMQGITSAIRSPCFTTHVAHVPHGCPLYVLGLLKNYLYSLL